MIQDFDALNTFVEVIDRGGFTAAAKRLGISKSIASRRITRLEASLKTRLINRSTRGLAPTEAGLEFHERCRTLLKELEDACEQAAGRGGEVSGALRLTAPASFGSALVVPVLAQLMRQHPRLQFQVHLDERRLSLLDEGFDLAIRAGPLPSSTLVARPLAMVGGVVVASPSYLARLGTPKQPADLAQHVCLDHAELPAGELWRFKVPGGSAPVHFEQRLRINSFDALRDMAIDGAGITLLPPFSAAPAIARGALIALLPEHELVAHGMSVVFQPERRLSSKLRVVVDAFVDYARRPVAQWGSAA